MAISSGIRDLQTSVATASTRDGDRCIAARVALEATGRINSSSSASGASRPPMRRPSAMANSARCSRASALTHFDPWSGQPAGDGAVNGIWPSRRSPPTSFFVSPSNPVTRKAETRNSFGVFTLGSETAQVSRERRIAIVIARKSPSVSRKVRASFVTSAGGGWSATKWRASLSEI